MQFEGNSFLFVLLNIFRIYPTFLWVRGEMKFTSMPLGHALPPPTVLSRSDLLSRFPSTSSSALFFSSHLLSFSFTILLSFFEILLSLFLVSHLSPPSCCAGYRVLQRPFHRSLPVPYSPMMFQAFKSLLTPQLRSSSRALPLHLHFNNCSDVFSFISSFDMPEPFQPSHRHVIMSRIRELSRIRWENVSLL